MRVAVFDLDGTLADTSADLIAAANATLAETGFGAPLDPTRDRAFAFAGGRAMLRAGHKLAAGGSDAAAVEAAYPRLLQHYAANIDHHTTSIRRRGGGARRAGGGGLEARCLHQQARRRWPSMLLARLGLRKRFGAMLGADSLPVRKPDPRHLLETIARAGGAPGRAVLVGDTVTDRDAARAAGVACVLVSFGPEGRGIAALEPGGAARPL